MRVALLSVSAAAVLWGNAALPTLAAPEELPAVEAAEEAVALSPLAGAIRKRLDAAANARSQAEASLIADIRSYYETRQFEPVWIRQGRPTGQIEALARRIADARLDALDPADYPLPDLAADNLDDVDTVAKTDFAASLAVVRYVTHLAAGRVTPRSLSKHVTENPEKPVVADILAGLAASTDIDAALKSFEPRHAQYWALKRKLAELLAATDVADQPAIPHGRVLRHGSHDPRVVLLRRRLGAELADGGDPELFDRNLLNAVREFQTKNALGADGIVGQGTLAALNRDNRQSLIATISANIERWRWMPRQLGQFHVDVNIPEFTLRVVRGGKIVHTTRVIVGKRSNPTPVFSDEMEHLIVNPYWNVPTSIVSNEMLPDIMIDPTGFFYRNGYELFARGQGRGGMFPVHPEMVDWFTIDPKEVLIRQPPGRGNALGRIKFMFPNRHAVYLHDTPTKNLFKRNVRAFSHGCVRVMDPMAFADVILADDPDWDSRRLERMFGGEERKVELSRHIPVHLTYFTAVVGDDGTVETFGDLYGYDQAITRLTNR